MVLLDICRLETLLRAKFHHSAWSFFERKEDFWPSREDLSFSFLSVAIRGKKHISYEPRLMILEHDFLWIGQIRARLSGKRCVPGSRGSNKSAIITGYGAGLAHVSQHAQNHSSSWWGGDYPPPLDGSTCPDTTKWRHFRFIGRPEINKLQHQKTGR